MGELRLGEGGLLRFQRQNKQSRGAHTATRAHGAAARKAPFFLLLLLLSVCFLKHFQRKTWVSS